LLMGVLGRLDDLLSAAER
jgi:hypothetical protein